MSTELVSHKASGLEVERRTTSPLEILEAAVRGGITQESVAVVKELAAMCREQRAEDAKAAFAKAFFQLRRNMPEFYADKSVTDNYGKVAFVYMSEAELSRIIEPHLLSHGFTMMAGQSESEGKITVDVTLIHEAGHSETRSFTVRALTPNKMIQGEKCDTGAATTAWRHLMIKMLGLKSRIQDERDPRVEGERITNAQAEELQRRVLETESNEVAFLKFCGVTVAGKPTLEDYSKIFSGKYVGADSILRGKENKGR